MNTRILKAEASDGTLDLSGLKEAAECLSSGGIVAFPTETVYGLGANSDISSAVQRLYALKGRPENKPFSLHIASKDDVAAHVSVVPGKAKRLMHRFWPGPLTIVFSSGGRTIGIRLPANRIAVELIRAAGVPVVAPSANLSGEEPAWNADMVAGTFDGRIDIIVDGGASELRQASTVVSVDGSSVEVLREGIIGREDIERTVETKILFVCGGNSCRSPMAEAICRKLLLDTYGVSDEELTDLGFEISSAGISAFDGGIPSDQAVIALGNLGFGRPRSRSARVTSEMINSATHIFTMTQAQKMRVLETVPEAQLKVELLDPVGNNVADPIGSPVASYEECARTIRTFLEQRLAKI